MANKLIPGAIITDEDKLDSTAFLDYCEPLEQGHYVPTPTYNIAISIRKVKPPKVLRKRQKKEYAAQGNSF